VVIYEAEWMALHLGAGSWKKATENHGHAVRRSLTVLGLQHGEARREA